MRESVRHKRLMRHKSIPLLKGNGTTAFPFVQNTHPRTPGPSSGRVVVSSCQRPARSKRPPGRPPGSPQIVAHPAALSGGGIQGGKAGQSVNPSFRNDNLTMDETCCSRKRGREFEALVRSVGWLRRHRKSGSVRSRTAPSQGSGAGNELLLSPFVRPGDASRDLELFCFERCGRSIAVATAGKNRR